MFEDLKVPTLAVVENMAHFTCDHGKRYYPFGRGGRDKLLKGLSAVTGTAGDGGSLLIQTQQDTLWRLQKCPMQSIPLVIDPEDNGNAAVSVSSRDVVGSSSSCSDVNCNHDHHNQTPSATGLGPVLPIVLREPLGESAVAFNRLADDVINEVFRSQAEAIMVCHFYIFSVMVIAV